MSPARAAMMVLLPRREFPFLVLGMILCVAMELAAPAMGVDSRFGIMTSWLFLGLPFALGWMQREVVSRDLLALLPGHRELLLRWTCIWALPLSFAISAAALVSSIHSLAIGIAVAACAQITGFGLGITGLRNPAVSVACVLPWLVISYVTADHEPLDHQATEGISYLAVVVSIICVVAAVRAMVMRIMAARRGQDGAEALPHWKPVPDLLVGVGTTGVLVTRTAWNIAVIHSRNLWSQGSAFLLLLVAGITGTAPFPAEWVMRVWFIMIILPGLAPAFGVMDQHVVQIGKGHVHEGMQHLGLLRRLPLTRRQGSAAWFLGLLLSALLHAGWMGIAIAGGVAIRTVSGHANAPDPLALGLVALAAGAVGAIFGTLLSTVTSIWVRLLILYAAMGLPNAGVAIGQVSGMELAESSRWWQRSCSRWRGIACRFLKRRERRGGDNARAAAVRR